MCVISSDWKEYSFIVVMARKEDGCFIVRYVHVRSAANVSLSWTMAIKRPSEQAITLFLLLADQLQ